MDFFQDGVSRTISLGWLQTSTLLITVSLVARITGISHQHPASITFIQILILKKKKKEKVIVAH
jgi:hypothetical protein